MQRWDIINSLIKKYDFKSYLEIGVATKENFNKIVCANKASVDPDPRSKATNVMTSDQFFNTILPTFTFDLIFIDGLHLAEQVERDINNSLKFLNSEGIIVVHDVNPIMECNQVEESPTGETYTGIEHWKLKKVWNGTVWKAWAKLRATREDLFMCTVNEECGIIKHGRQELLQIPDVLDWNYFNTNRKDILNCVDILDI